MQAELICMKNTITPVESSTTICVCNNDLARHGCLLDCEHQIFILATEGQDEISLKLFVLNHWVSVRNAPAYE